MRFPRHITVIYLDRTTPIIGALLGGFAHYDIACYRRHVCLLARHEHYVAWESVRRSLVQVATNMGVATEPMHDLTSAQVLTALSDYFSTRSDPQLDALISDNPFFGRVSLDTALTLAWCLNDGHNLFAAERHQTLRYGELRLPPPPTLCLPAAPTVTSLPSAFWSACRQGDPFGGMEALADELVRVMATLADRRVRAEVRRRMVK